MRFEVFSGGTVTFDLDKCARCPSKVCVQVCQTAGNGNILELDERGLPRLKVPQDQVAKGACVEDMGCMLACQIKGQNAIAFHLPMPELEQALKEMKDKPVYLRER